MPRENTKLFSVLEACDKLRQRGENITLDAVGRELVAMGLKRGSNTQLSHYVKAWREQQLALEQEKIILPQRPDKLTQVIDEIRTEAQREAAVALEQQKNAAEAVRQQLNDTLHYAQQEIAALRAQKIALEERHHALQKTAEQSTAYNKMLQDQLDNAQRELAEVKKLTAQHIAQLTAENANLITQLHTLIEAQRDVQASAKTERSELMEKMEAQRHQAIADHEKLRGAILSLEKELVKAQTERALVEKQNQELKILTKLFDQILPQLQETQHSSARTIIEQLATFIQEENKTLHNMPKMWHTDLSLILEKLHEALAALAKKITLLTEKS